MLCAVPLADRVGPFFFNAFAKKAKKSPTNGLPPQKSKPQTNWQTNSLHFHIISLLFVISLPCGAN